MESLSNKDMMHRAWRVFQTLTMLKSDILFPDSGPEINSRVAEMHGTLRKAAEDAWYVYRKYADCVDAEAGK